MYIIDANTLACDSFGGGSGEILKVIKCCHVIHKSYMTDKERKAHGEAKVNTWDFRNCFN